MKARIFFLISILLVGGLLWTGLQAVHPFGIPGETAMDDYFIANAQGEAAANNVVTSIVFDYRGFDTLGEGAVLFTAVISVAALFRKRGHN
jgi:multisubunit Na+/H+ antiporter MnhB subunit